MQSRNKRPPLSSEQLYQKAAAKCAARECCRADFEKKFEEAGISKSESETILDKLEDGKFIDEKRYAKAFTHDRLLYAGWGRMKIKQALALKKISPQDIANALQEINESDYREKLLSVIKAKMRSLKASSDYERKTKLARFAIGRGFEPDLVFECLNFHE